MRLQQKSDQSNLRILWRSSPGLPNQFSKKQILHFCLLERCFFLNAGTTLVVCYHVLVYFLFQRTYFYTWNTFFMVRGLRENAPFIHPLAQLPRAKLHYIWYAIIKNDKHYIVFQWFIVVSITIHLNLGVFNPTVLLMQWDMTSFCVQFENQLERLGK